jgi:hypothetical protein
MNVEQPTYDGVELVEAIFAVEQAIEALAPFDLSTSHLQQTLVQLRSYQDPWHEAKRAMKLFLDSGGHKVKAVAQYAQHLEQELSNRKPLWIVLPVDADDDLHFRPNGGLMEYVFLNEQSAEKHRQKAANPDDYRIRTLWGK